MTLRLTPEQLAAYERRRAQQIGNVEVIPGPPVRAKSHALARIPASESSVLRAVLEALRVHPKVAWAARINSGRFQIEGRWVNASFRGCSDLICQHVDGRLIACECKSDSGKTTPEQTAFLKLVADNGGIAFIARNAGDVFDALDEKAAA